MRWIMLYYASCGVTQIVKLALFALYKTYAIWSLKNASYVLWICYRGEGVVILWIFLVGPLIKDCVVKEFILLQLSRFYEPWRIIELNSQNIFNGHLSFLAQINVSQISLFNISLYFMEIPNLNMFLFYSTVIMLSYSREAAILGSL